MAINPDAKLSTGSGTLTANESFFDAMVRHQIGLLRVVGSIRNEVIALLDGTEADIRRQVVELSRRGVGFERPAQVARLERLLVTLEAIRGSAWRQVSELWTRELTNIALSEPRIVDAIAKTVVPVDLETQLPNARRLRDIVRFQPIEGRVLRDWSRGIAQADVERMVAQVRIGLTQGEAGPQIARRIVGRVSVAGRDGVFEITRRNAAAITRTLVNGVANFSRQTYHEENAHLFRDELFVATLDSRTTLICASLDGKTFDIGEGPVPPLHINCRSLRVALLDPEPIGERPANPTTQRQLLREFAEEEGIEPVRRRADLPRGMKGRFDAFARARKRELIGRVPAATSYDEFLRRQSVEFQNDYLGPTRARLYRAGVDLGSLVDPSGRPIPLSELARFEADAFRAAGFDPSNFTN